MILLLGEYSITRASKKLTVNKLNKRMPQKNKFLSKKLIKKKDYQFHAQDIKQIKNIRTCPLFFFIHSQFFTRSKP